jgi:hypothetical protein
VRLKKSKARRKGRRAEALRAAFFVVAKAKATTHKAFVAARFHGRTVLAATAVAACPASRLRAMQGKKTALRRFLIAKD